MKDKYEKLAKKYDLPSYEGMVKHFEVDSIGKDDNVLREILKKMYEKIDYYTNTLESLIQPETSYSSMKEASTLNVAEQTIVKKLFTDCMCIIREFTEFGLEYSDYEAAKFINNVYAGWVKMKPELKKILGKVRDVWKKQQEIKVEKGYFG